MPGNEPLPIRIGDRVIDDDAPVLVVAEAGVNHNGDASLARRLVDAAAEAGADAVKFQTFAADALVTRDSPAVAYQRTTGARTQRDLLAELELPLDEFARLAELARRRGLIFLSTPFDEQSADALEDLVPAYKLASPEVTNVPLLEHVAAKRKPILLSTGMADEDEVAQALRVMRGGGAADVVLLHATTAYPTEPRDANVRAVATLRERFGLHAGFSDHTRGSEAAVAAVALGARVVEKHLTLDRALRGPDHAASLDPDEMRRFVASIRAVEEALGDGVKRAVEAEAEARTLVRRSLAAREDIAAGTLVTRELLVTMRPATGISPSDLDAVVGRRLRRPVARGELLSYDALE